MRVDIFHYCGPNTGAQQAGLRQRSSCHKQFNAAGHRRDAMATERLHAAQERLAELVNSRDACIAFAAGSVLGSASAALAVFWLQRREQTRHQPAAAAAAVCKASGLRAVLDIDEGLAVGAPPGPDKGSHTGAANLYHFCTATGSSQRRVQAQALADVLARCPEIRENADAALASATGVLAGRWLGCAWFPLRYDLQESTTRRPSGARRQTGGKRPGGWRWSSGRWLPRPTRRAETAQREDPGQVCTICRMSTICHVPALVTQRAPAPAPRQGAPRLLPRPQRAPQCGLGAPRHSCSVSEAHHTVGHARPALPSSP